jgi:hypothetical protein
MITAAWQDIRNFNGRGEIVKTATLAGLVAMVIGLVAAMPAAADMTITVSCSGGGLSGSQQFAIPCNDGLVNWNLASPVEIMANGVTLGTINGMTVETCDEPYVVLFFDVEAGTSDTTFDINSSVVSFSAMANPLAYASAGVTLTSDNNGATMTGLLGQGKAYRAIYNGSSVYADLVDGYSILGDLTDTHSDRQPAAGNDTILDTVSSIQSEFKFELSALDQASGTSRFEVTPEPATLVLLGVGGAGLMAVRRRRRR